MPRPRKAGLDYFPEDTNRRNDFKIMDLLNEYGPLGYVVYDFCLQYIYENGYYLEVPRKILVLSLVKDIGAKWVKNKDLVGQIIDYCAEIGLFNKNLLNQNVMTSVGIQRRYDSATVRNKANKTKYWLLDLKNKNVETADISVPNSFENATETPENATETPENATETQQSKVNKSKVNKSIIYVSSAAEAASDTGEYFISLILNDKSFYNVPISDVKHYKELYPAVDVEQELRSMCGWLEANIQRRKTRSGIKKFISNWLSKAQNQGGIGYVGNNIRGGNSEVPSAGQDSGGFRTGEKVF